MVQYTLLNNATTTADGPIFKVGESGLYTCSGAGNMAGVTTIDVKIKRLGLNTFKVVLDKPSGVLTQLESIDEEFTIWLNIDDELKANNATVGGSTNTTVVLNKCG